MSLIRFQRTSGARRRPLATAIVRGAVIACAVAACLASIATAAGADSTWTVSGQGASDNRTQPDETTITTSNVSELAPKWIFTTQGDVTATPTVSNGIAYFPDAGGYLYAVNTSSGQLVWQQQISAYDGVTGSISKNSPAIYYDAAIGGDELILGDNFSGAHASGAHVFGINASTGALLWSTQVDSNQAAIITSGPQIAGNEVIVPVSSDEETLAENDSYPCCTFRGSVVALDPTTGDILWKTYTVPANSGPCKEADPERGCGYTGGAVWSNPAYDPTTNTIYVGTGNNYTTPGLATLCDDITTLFKKSNDGCTAKNDYFDAIVAINASTGKILWGTKVQGWDASTVACVDHLPGVTWCPSPRSPDYDFGSGPNLINVTAANGQPETLIGVGQKSGVYWALNSTTGAIEWSTLVGPGSSLGGVMWGTAFDGTSIYVPEANPFHTSFKLSSGTTITNGAWSAVNPVTGALEWQTQVPGNAAAFGPVSSADGIVFAGSSASAGDNMFALDGATGQILWSFPSAGSVASSPSIVDGNVFWGSGYSEFSSFGWTGADQLYDFTLNGD